MGIVDYIAIAAIILAVGGAVFYIVRSKRRGERCIGCPYAKECSGKCGRRENGQSNNNKTES